MRSVCEVAMGSIGWPDRLSAVETYIAACQYGLSIEALHMTHGSHLKVTPCDNLPAFLTYNLQINQRELVRLLTLLDDVTKENS
jgi:hypothetical protein